MSLLPDPDTTARPVYATKQTTRGSVVVLGNQIVTDEMTTEKAAALAARYNMRMLIYELSYAV